MLKLWVKSFLYPSIQFSRKFKKASHKRADYSVSNKWELVTVIGSNHFGLDDYIKGYLLEHSDISFSTAIKIILRYYTTPEFILQLTEFKNHLKAVDFCLFQEIFEGKSTSYQL